MTNLDKAGKKYWDHVWDSGAVSRPVDPHKSGIRHHVKRQFHRWYESHLGILRGSDISLIEVGCANSAWLPYFNSEYGFSVTGLDYSELGCAQAKAVLESAGVEGEVVHADMFNPPERLSSHFDVVVSSGLIEHFSETSTAVKALGTFLKPGGMMITVIPNMLGIAGLCNKWFNPKGYAVHVPMNLKQLREAHEAAGLEILEARYLFFWNMGVTNVENWKGTPIYYLLFGTFHFSNAVVWSIESVLPMKPNRFWLWTS
jgi:2-polyprenyl-3-methyl-5-hydroxy-6-metoxy-1,4-benzoquinol methylase